MLYHWIMPDNILKFESNARPEESDGEGEEMVGGKGKEEGGSDFTAVTVEAWTSFNR